MTMTTVMIMTFASVCVWGGGGGRVGVGGKGVPSMHSTPCCSTQNVPLVWENVTI